MNSIPNSWIEIEIENIAAVVGGGTPKASDPSNFENPSAGIAWLTPADLSGYKKKTISFGKRDISMKGYDSSSARLMPAGTVLFTSRAPIGYVVVAENEIATNQGFKSFVLDHNVSSDYTYYYLKSIKGLAESRGTGTTFKELSGAAAKKLPFVLAPLNEQIRIANKLDELLAQVDTIKVRVDAIPDILKRFRQSVLAAAVSGRLTEEWRDKNVSQKWTNPLLEELILASANGLSKRKGDKGDEVTILRLADFKDAERVYGNERKIKLDEKEKNKYGLAQNDILVIRVNGSVDLAGRFIEYNSEEELEGFCDHFIRLRLDTERIFSKYLTFVANEGLGRQYLKNSLSTSAGQNTINQTSVKGLEVPLPSIEEQTEIVNRVEKLFAFADLIEQRVQDAQSRIDKLTQSILAKAFRGELVEQDPNDEPASELLARIKAEREAAAELAKAAKKAPKKTPKKTIKKKQTA